MKSYSQMLTQFGISSGKTDTSSNAAAAIWFNDGIRSVLGMPINWKFLESSFTLTTTTNISTYFLPYNFDKLSSVKILVGTFNYVVKQVKNRDEWNRITSVVYQSSYPIFYYLNNRTIEFFPTPQSTGNTITFNYKKRAVDLQNTDYTTGTITATNNSTTITGAGTTFTSGMVGRYLKVNADGNWYLITGFTNATTIAIEQPYQGTTVAGAAYTIGEMSVLPENHDMIPIYYALMQYWRPTQLDKARENERYYNEEVKKLVDDNIMSSMDTGLTLDYQIEDPNFYPQNIT